MCETEVFPQKTKSQIAEIQISKSPVGIREEQTALIATVQEFTTQSVLSMYHTQKNEGCLINSTENFNF
jgi:hydroxypyruvate isomerase